MTDSIRALRLPVVFSVVVLLLLLLPAVGLAQHAGHGGSPFDEGFGTDHLCHHAVPGLVGGPDDGASADGKEAEGEEAEGEGADGEEEKDEKWDVQAPPIETYQAEIDVTEGTWMNLDVSPDGMELVFDLLGDLYRLPIEGGEATALTSGLAWDMQPRYSPDGRFLSFTSDRVGGDNIWLLPLDGQGDDGAEPRQVTKESFRLLNNAAWSPDGQFLAARKHFTSRRSLGAGEIWLYHRSGEGSQGLQLNDRPNDQQDLGEPAFSPDGRYVYFSQDTTQGPFFEYNKDSNGQIYEIRRIDLETGEIEGVVSGAGGAVRPTPSPDGQYLAFVRRVRFQSVLFVRDLESGEERPLFDGLDRDLQETWAVHGVYPNFAWTPDSRSLVFWAGGKIHRLDLGTDLASAELSEIPFRVRQAHQLIEAVRYAQDVAPEQFPVRMLRWVRVSPDGSEVLFQALGKLWVKALPDGEPRRLTTQDEHFELYPSWSRDGKQVVYVSWHDEELGAVRLVSASGAADGRVLTAEPGHFVEPTLSPDGAQVVYRKTGGGFVTSGLHSEDPGLYIVPAKGGEARELSESGYGPHFGADPGRVYFLTSEAEGRRALRSLRLDGLEPRHHATSELATEMRVSPDGRWLAFVERFRAHVAPLVASAKPLDLGPDAKSLPLATVSAEAGEYLHWSGDSKTLHWSLGPELFSRPLADAFAFLDGAPEELPEPPATGTAIGFEARTDAPTGSIALVGGRVVTMNGDQVIEDGVVLTDGPRLVAVGARSEVEIPADAVVVDVAGKTVLPGFVDVHWHGSQGTSEIQPQQNWFNYASLAFGVTTAHDPSNDTSTFFAASEMQKAGEIVAPRLYSTGTILYGAGGPAKAEIDSLDDARFHLERMKAVGAFSVKSYNQPRRDQRQQVIAAAKELEMLVMPEGGSLFMHNLTQVVDGHTGIEHAIPLARLYDDVVQLWSATRVAYTPTLGVGYGGIWGENYWYAKTDVWANERLLSFVPRERVDPVSRRPFQAPEEEYNHVSIAEGCKQLSDAGVKVNVGAHGQREGLAVHWEMWMLEQGGMTPHEALRAGTLNGAEYIGMEAELGSLEPGKLADVAIIDGNPLDDLRTSEKVSHVMINGRLYEASTMHQLAPEKVERSPFYFEQNRSPLVSAER